MDHTAVSQPRTSPRSRGRLLVAAGAAVLLALALAAAVFLLGRGDDRQAPAAAPSAGGVPVMVDGRDYFVGTNVDPGVYRQREATPVCQWAAADPVTGEPIEQSLAGAPGPATVNLGSDTKFRSEGCGAWVKG